MSGCLIHNVVDQDIRTRFSESNRTFPALRGTAHNQSIS